MYVVSRQKSFSVERVGLTPLPIFQGTVKNLVYWLQKHKCLEINQNLKYCGVLKYLTYKDLIVVFRSTS